MSFSEKSCLVFEQATKAYHITDHIDATVHNPYEVKSKIGRASCRERV